MAGKITYRLALRCLFSFLLCAGMALSPGQPALATAYTVNSLADTNDGNCNSTNCTLREAIMAAMVGSANDSISFSVSGTIMLGDPLPSISSTGGTLTIDGAGQSITIDGNEAVRPFYVISGASLALQNLTVTRGYASTHDGGGVWNNGTLAVADCNFSYNVASNSGGAIANTGSLTVTNTTFSNNGIDYYSGGGIYNQEGATATISGSGFLLNHAELEGAIHNNGSLTVRDSTFGFNTAGSRGGAIANESSDPIRIEDSTLSFNSATYEGCAIYLFTGEYTVYVQNCTLEFNEAPEGGRSTDQGQAQPYLLGKVK